MYDESQLHSISDRFQIYGEFLHAEPCKIGHINETYTATYNQAGSEIRYIHQKINKKVFKEPDKVMENVMRVTTHLRSKLRAQGVQDFTRRALTVIPTREGSPYYYDDKDSFWRTFLFIENIQTFEQVESPEQAYEAGKAFGHFQCNLADLPGERLHDTIPGFHDTRKRFESLRKAISNDTRNRAAKARKEIDFALAQESIVDVLQHAFSKHEIPERITHNDTKFNNVMLDIKSGRQMCVVDLDTVMPGLVHYDFGDMIRTTTSPTLEDEVDLDKVQMQMPVFKELARGYLETANGFLSTREKELLAFSGLLISYTIGIRFLADYLNGDQYFRVHRPGHNLDRARTQFRLMESIREQLDAMNQIVSKYS